MKFFLAVFVLTIVLAINAKDIDITGVEKCLKEVGIDDDVYKVAMKEKIEDADLPIKCLTKCMLKDKKMINEDGTYNVEKIAASLFTEPENVEEAKPFVELCLKEQQKGDKAETEEAEKKEEEAKKEPSCQEAYNMILCVDNKIEEALKNN